MVVFGQKWLYFDKVVVFRQTNCVWVKWLYSGKSGCIHGKWLNLGKTYVFEQSGCIRSKWLFSGKVVVFGQKQLYS